MFLGMTEKGHTLAVSQTVCLYYKDKRKGERYGFYLEYTSIEKAQKK